MASPHHQPPANIYEDQNSETVDGFRSIMKKNLSKLSCISPDVARQKQDLLDSTDNKKRKQLPAEFDWNDNEYDFSNSKRGLAIIINNEDFSKCKELEDIPGINKDTLASNGFFRDGSSKDASALTTTFKSLGFDVEQHDNLDGRRMFEVLEAASKNYDHKASDCFVCAILTHGDNVQAEFKEYPSEKMVRVDCLYGVDGEAIATYDLVETVGDTSCPHLKDKPRLFFIQACRGKKSDDGCTIPKSPSHQGGGDNLNVKKKDLTEILPEETCSSRGISLQDRALDVRDALEDPPPHDDVDNPHPRPFPAPKDFLIMYAAPPDHSAWRHEDDGSWFIQTLCRVLNNTDLRYIHLLRALTIVSDEISRNFETKDDKKKTVPEIESRLLKDIFIRKRQKETADDILKKKKKT